MRQIWTFPYTFVLMNWAAVVSFFHYARKGKNVGKEIWTASLTPHTHEPSAAIPTAERTRKIAA